ncbi:MAG: hypothetical protein ACFFD3_05255 [Candidatus Thorarchaeota archaeon]
MIELTISLAITGALVLLSAFGRLRYFPKYRIVSSYLRESFDVSNMDFSGNTAYPDCFSHDWVVDLFTKKRHGRLGNWFQRQLFYSTLFTSLWFGIIAGVSSILFGLLIVSALLAIGAGVVIFFFGAIIAMGPGGPKYSQELLLELYSLDRQKLSKEDYAFVKVAIRSVSQWTLLSLVIAIVFLLSAPFGTLLFDTIGIALLQFGEAILWGPMFNLFEVWAPLGVIYISLVAPFIFIIIPLVLYLIYRRTRYRSLFDVDEA